MVLTATSQNLATENIKSYIFLFCDHGPAFGAQKQFSKTNLKNNDKEDNGVENYSSQYAQDLLFPQLKFQGNLGL